MKCRGNNILEGRLASATRKGLNYISMETAANTVVRQLKARESSQKVMTASSVDRVGRSTLGSIEILLN